MIKKHLYVLEEQELIILSNIIKEEEKNGYKINISECGMFSDFPLRNSVSGFKFVFVPKE